MSNRRRRKAMLFTGIALLPGVLSAQEPPKIGEPDTAPAVVVAGTPTIDLITLRGTSPGVPLRYGSIVPNSETVEFEGKRLTKGSDYQIDYPSGVIYLMRAQKAGQSMRVSYRYEAEKQKATDGKTQFGGLPTFRYDLLPGGSLGMIMGFGMTERQSDGNVLSSNLYGWNNNFTGKGAKLGGLLMFGERNKVDNQSGFEYKDKPGEVETGRSKFVLQNLTSNFLGGTISADYQDISKNFAGFRAAKDAGYDGKFVDQLEKERGMKRMGFDMKGMNLGGLKLSNGYRSVTDGDGSVDWRSYGVEMGGLKLNYNSQRVDQNFKRFNDLAEEDREQLRKEAGLVRQNLGGEWASKMGKMSFSTNEVEDLEGNGIYRRKLEFDAGKFSLKMGDQSIDQQFNRFNSLFENERGQWGKEAGMSRQWLGLSAAVSGSQSMKFDYGVLRNDQGEFRSEDLNVGGRGWNLEYGTKRVDKGFGGLGALSEGEMDTHIKSIASMYQKTGIETRPQDRGEFLRSAGLDRTFTRFSAQPFKSWNVELSRLSLAGDSDGGKVDTFKLDGKNLDINYRQQDVGQQFTELAGMMEFERRTLGILPGLNKTDLGMNLTFGSRSFSANTMKASTAEGGVSRNSFNYVDPKISVEVNTRNVDEGFNGVNQIVDPERDFLNSIKGFNQRDIKVKWDILKNLKFESFLYESEHNSTEEERYIRNMMFTWKPDSKTEFGFTQLASKNDDPMNTLFASMTQRLTLSRDFGKLGNVRFLNETQTYDGEQNQRPDQKTQYLAYNLKLNTKTSVSTEQTRTQFEDGQKEDISAHTISTELSNRAGVSVTDISIDRNGDDRDEKKRNYGFWFDLGKGMRINYGYKRDINGQKGTLNSTVGITPGEIGGMKLDSGMYSENRWDGERTQGLSNIQFSSTKSFRLGFLTDLGFKFGMDTATDNTAWVRENRLVSLSGKIGSNTVGYEYKSQMHQTGFRGIDRLFSFETDKKSWLQGYAKYKMRQLPDDQKVMIRDIGLTVKPTKGIEITHQMLTNPEEQFRGDVILGSLTSPWRVNRWKIDVNSSNATSFGMSWEEKINDQSSQLSRIGGLNLTLFKTSGSPLSLFYGVEQRDGGGPIRQTAHRYWVKFDQRPGPNQLLSIFAGNVSYQHSIADGFQRNNWTVQANYQLKF